MMTLSEAIMSFDDYLDEDGGEVVIMGVAYMRSYLLQQADPIAYRCGLADYIDAMGIDSDDLIEDTPWP